jgi:hypothetical protein
MKVTTHRWLTVAMSCMTLMALTGTQIPAYAATNTNASGNRRMIIDCQYDGEPVEGEQCDIYKVAKVSEDGSIAWTDDFENYQVDHRLLTDENNQDLAETLTGYALRDNLESCYSGISDEEGLVTINIDEEEFDDGYYLVVQGPNVTDEGLYSADSSLIDVSWDDMENGTLELTPKIRLALVDDYPVGMDMTAIKIWEDDDDSASARPESIEVQLLQDGEVYDTQTLSKDNNWRYTWSQLDPMSEWRIVEKDVAQGYVVTSATEDNVCSVTNTYEKTENKPQQATTSSGTTGKLPQTGQVWWPVPILFAAGFIMMIVGLLRGKDRGKLHD